MDRCEVSKTRDLVAWVERIGLVLVCLAAAPFVSGQMSCGGPPPEPDPEPDTREDCASSDPLRQPFFGDLHAHTSSSLDADLQGTRLGPDDAYGFAQGATVEIQPYDEAGNGLRQLTIDRPLDFAMVADHAEFFGEISICRNAENPVPGSMCDFYQSFPEVAFFFFNIGLSASPASVEASPSQGHNPEVCGPDGQLCIDESITLWDEIQNAAENAYDRSSACNFTSFVGYEWTGSPGAKNLHRNVLFRTATTPSHATSYFDAPYIESLWDALESDCQDPDCEFLTIPHNPNLSSGIYFNQTDRDGNPYTEALAARRKMHEPLVEMMQHKGQSECIPESSPSDEFCSFEVLPFSTLAGPGIASGGPPKPQDFVRPVLTEGVKLQRTLGENPFKYGMVGSTDTHLATPGAVSEDNYPGHGGAGAAAATELPPGLTDHWYYNPGGLAVVWAEENSRDSLFSAMQRKEVYATSGSRPVVRFFGGIDIDPNICASSTMIEDAYSQGVPMGSDLGPPNPYNIFDPPRFLLNVQKDPAGADLQQIQIVKVMVFGDGTTYEWVYDVAGDPDNGASVDPNTCAPQGTGFSELCKVWTDPFFNPNLPAFYYARVLENPTCRWHKRQCIAGGVDCAQPETVTTGFEACCNGVAPDTIQERAWTSPIWFTPNVTRQAEALQPGQLLVLQGNSPAGTDGYELVRVDADGGNPTTLYSFPDLAPYVAWDMEIAGPNTAYVTAINGTFVDVHEVDLLNGTASVLASFSAYQGLLPFLAVEPTGDLLVSSNEPSHGILNRINRVSGAVTTAWTDQYDNYPLMISAGADGMVAAIRPVDVNQNEIIKIDLTTGQSTPLHTTTLGLFGGTRIDVLDGTIFSNGYGPDNKLVRIDPVTLQVETLFESPTFTNRTFVPQRTGVLTTHLLFTWSGVKRQALETGAVELIHDAPGKAEIDVAVLYPACSDGIDNDHDGAVDFPADSRCANPLDNHEQPY